MPGDFFVKRSCAAFGLLLLISGTLCAFEQPPDPRVGKWLRNAAAEAERINDQPTRMMAWWRIAGVAAEVGDDELCETALKNALKDVPGGAGAQGMARAFAVRFRILAKLAAGRIDEAELMVKETANRDKTDGETAKLAHVVAKKENDDLRTWVEGLKEPADRAGAWLGAAMRLAGVDAKDVLAPDVLLR